MDLLWLFILIFGVVVSIGQKSQKKAPTDGETVPEELDPQQEFERRIRELLQEDKPAAKPAASTTKQVATMATERAKVENTQSRVATKKACAERPKEQPKEAEELDQIVDDFSIEKAVIYAEILKPKYEEY
ncbi:MAG: hypothetical protein E7136_02600 [Rikenellaceae bacterium]|nr:hypothetical protein [Rikenellaceae bacterium]